MKKFFSCLMAAAMVSAAVSVPVLAAESGEFTETVYYEAKALNQPATASPAPKDYTRDLTYHVGNGDGKPTLKDKTCVGWNSGDTPENAVIELEFNVPTAGTYSMRSLMVDIFNRQMGEYVLKINGNECKRDNPDQYILAPEDGEPDGDMNTDKTHTGRGLSCAAVLVNNIPLKEGKNTLSLQTTKGSVNGSTYRTLYIYDMEFTSEDVTIYDACTGKNDYRNFESSNVAAWSKDKNDWAFNPWLNLSFNDGKEYSKNMKETPKVTYNMKVSKSGNYYPIVFSRDLGSTANPSTFDMTVGDKKFNCNTETMTEVYNLPQGGGRFAEPSNIYCYKTKTPVKLEEGISKITFEVPNALNSPTNFWVGIRAFGLAATEDPLTDITANTAISGANDDGTYKVGMKFAESFNPQNYKYIVFTAGKTKKGNEITNIKALSDINGDAVLAIILDNSPSGDVTVTVTNEEVSFE